MPVNLAKPQLWKNDIMPSVAPSNERFVMFAPDAYRKARVEATRDVGHALRMIRNLLDITPAAQRLHPTVITMLRMTTAPPIRVRAGVGERYLNRHSYKSDVLRKRDGSFVD